MLENSGLINLEYESPIKIREIELPMIDPVVEQMKIEHHGEVRRLELQIHELTERDTESAKIIEAERKKICELVQEYDTLEESKQVTFILLHSLSQEIESRRAV